MIGSGYEPLEVLFSGTYAEILRCRRVSDGAKVVVKHLLAKTRNNERIARLRHEHATILELERAGARNTPRAAEFLENNHDFAMVTYDIGGISLDQQQKASPLTLAQILHTAVQCCRALLDAHAVGVVHKDIKPHNIVLNAATQQVQLIDFGLAARVFRDGTLAEDVRGLEGTLSHMAPEQTGRLQVRLDRRIDFYGLGAMLYDLVAGRPPVLTQSRGNMIHALLTEHPPAPRTLVPQLPEVVEHIILKLLKKNPHARYASAHGLLHDLERCERAWAADGRIVPFELATQDRSECLEWPPETLGREAEMDAMVAAASPLSRQRMRICTVEASYGVGKTALLRGVAQKLHDETGAWFAIAPCDASKMHVGLHGMSQALDALVRQMLMGTEREVDVWRRRIREAVGTSGAAVVQLIPVLEALLGAQPPLAELGPRESENRLLAGLLRLLYAIAEHKALILCLDDAQWADVTTVNLLQALEDRFAGPGAFSYIIAYDPQEMPREAAVDAWLKQPRAATRITAMHLRPMTLAQVTTVLRSLLGEGDVPALAQVVHAKTSGNYSAVRAFTDKLWRDGIITFDVHRGQWLWDAAAAFSAPATDDAAASIIDRVSRLPEACRLLLGQAACIGSAFDMAELQEVIDDPQSMWAWLARAHEDGVVGAPDSAGILHFTHEQVRLHVQGLLAPDQARAAHANIARHMRDNRPESPGRLWFCELADHTNAACVGDAEAFAATEVADTNLHAAQSAYQSFDYKGCVAYLECALVYLNRDAAARADAIQAALALKIQAYKGAGNVEAAEATVSLLQRDAHTVPQRVFAAEKKANWQWTRGQYVQALDTHVERAHLLGEKMPPSPGLWHVVVQRLRFAFAMWLRRETPETLATKPFMTDPHKQQVVLALRSALLPSALVRPYLLLWTAYRIGELSARYGVEQTSAAAWSAVLMQAVREGKHAQAERWAACMRKLAERADRDVPRAYVELIIVQQIEGLTQHPQVTVERMEQVARVLADNGEYSSAIWAYMSHQTVLTNVSLEAAVRFTAKMRESAACVLNPAARTQMEILAAHAQRFIEGAAPSTESIDDLTQIGKRGFLPVLEWIAAIEFNLAARNLSRAHEAAKQLSLIPFTRSTAELMTAWQCIMTCLACTQYALAQGRGTKLPRYFYKARARLRQLSRMRNSQILGASSLIDAEEAALGHDFARASRLYEQACAQSEASGFVSLHAFSAECAGRWYQQCGLDGMAKKLIAHSSSAYTALGAAHKGRALKSEFHLEVTPYSLEDSTFDTTARDAARILDMLRDTAQSMARDHNLTSLAEKLHARVGECISASRLVVFLGSKGTSDGVIFEGGGRAELPVFLQSTSPPATSFCVNDLALATEYAADPYFAAHGCGSFGYVPIVYKGHVGGWVYYESNDVFDLLQHSLIVLNLLCGQAALAIENAANFARLEHEVEARTQEERRAKTQLFEAAHDHAEIQMAAGFAHEIRNAVSSARLALSAAYRLDPRAPMSLHEEARRSWDAASACLDPIDASGGADGAAGEAFIQHCTTLRDTMQTAQTYLQSAYESVERAMAVTNQVLEYAEAGQLVAGDHRTQVADILDELVKGIATDLQARGVALEVHVDPDLELPMREDHAFAVLRNLLANARDAVCDPAGGNAQPHIVLHAHEQAHKVVVSVADTGIGMSAASQAKVFRPFFSTKGPRGTGLGLGLSRKLVRLYGGDLEFSSEEGKGTTFTLSVPQLE